MAQCHSGGSMPKDESYIYDENEGAETISYDYKKKKSRLGTIIRIIFYLFILFLNTAIILRVCMYNDPKKIENFAATPRAREAYAASDGSLTIYTQEIYDIYTKDGHFYSTAFYYIAEADEIQVAIRYNVHALEGYFIENGYDSEPTAEQIRENEYFAFRLKDSYGNYYEPAFTEGSSRFMYVYRKLAFNGIKVLNGKFGIEIYPICNGTPDYDTVLGTMTIYNPELSTETYRLTRSDRERLSQ